MDSRQAQPHLELLKPVQVLLLLLLFAAAAPGAVGVGARGAGDAVQCLKEATWRGGAGPASALLDGVQQAPVSVCCIRGQDEQQQAAAAAAEARGACDGDRECDGPAVRQAQLASIAVSRPGWCLWGLEQPSTLINPRAANGL